MSNPVKIMKAQVEIKLEEVGIEYEFDRRMDTISFEAGPNGCVIYLDSDQPILQVGEVQCYASSTDGDQMVIEVLEEAWRV